MALGTGLGAGFAGFAAAGLAFFAFTAGAGFLAGFFAAGFGAGLFCFALGAALAVVFFAISCSCGFLLTSTLDAALFPSAGKH